jgi:putative addiction module antidote
MLALKLRQVGKSTGTIFPKELLAKLNVQQGDALYAIETGSGILLTASNPEIAKQVSSGERCLRKYREAMDALAK